MVGELIQGAISEFRDDNDASDPLATVGRFVGAAFDLEVMSEVVEIAGNMEGGLDGVFPEIEQTPALDNTLNNINKTNVDPMFANGPTFGGNTYT